MPEPSLGLSPIRVNQTSVVGEVVKQLLNYLVSNRIGPGDKLPSERNLSEYLGLGRTSVREAVKTLHMLGIVEVRQGDGTYLRRTDSNVLPQILEWGLLLGQQRTHDLVEAREYLEIFVARRAAQRVTPEGVSVLERHLDRMRAAAESGHSARLAEADVEFHLAIAEMAGNSVFIDVLRSIRTLLHVWITRALETEGFADSVEQHVRVAAAIEAGDPDAAEHAMRAHMTSAGERLLACLPKTTAQ